MLKRWFGGTCAVVAWLSATGWLSVAGCSQVPASTEEVTTAREPLHELLVSGAPCVFQSEAHVPLLAEALLPTGYGNWCGQGISGPLDPINCWDAACKVHDYAFGRWQDGFVSCHQIVGDQNMSDASGVREDTPCTLIADAVICQSWTTCNTLSDQATNTWRLHGAGGHQVKVCNPPNPGGRPGNHGPRIPTWCAWLNTWTCEDLFPCPAPPPFTPPATNCGFPMPASITPSETVANAIALTPEAAQFCCQQYSQSVRDSVKKCCVPKTCADLGANCGTIDDGCGNQLICGAADCLLPETCGGAGVPNQCGCTPITCAATGASCGIIPDQCGGTIICDTCTFPDTCGGAGVPNQCGCTPATCQTAGAQCGAVATGCGGTLDCGGCPAPLVCGGAGSANECDCPSGTFSCGGQCVSGVCPGGQFFDLASCSCVGAGIQVVSASYGSGNCGTPVGNVTGVVAGTCDGLNACSIFVHNGVFGDPAFGCPKDFTVTWVCGADPTLNSADHGPVAGEGYTVDISCP